jgi:hypothetical protein
MGRRLGIAVGERPGSEMKDPFRKDGLSKALEEALRQQRLVEQLQKPAAAEGLSKAIEEATRQQRLIEQLQKPAAGARLLDSIEQATAARSLMEAAHQSKLLSFTQSSAYLTAIEAASAATKVAELHRFIAPKLPEILSLSAFAAAHVPPFQVISEQNWHSIISDRMAKLDVAWAYTEELAESAGAFARLSRLSDVARFSTVYADETTEILVDELGKPSEAPSEVETVQVREARFDEAGRDRELIAFPPPAYGQILISAGYAIAFPQAPAGVIEEGLVETVRFSPETGAILQSLEAHLRAHITAKMHSIEGEAWIKRRVPFELREKWKEGREAAKAAGKPVFALINYSNFMDLGSVITTGNNWTIFQSEFTNKDNLLVGLRRLYYIRNDIAHSRPISMTDELVAMTEGTILFRAMGLPVKYGN